MASGGYQTFYDVSRNWIGFAPVLLTAGWILGTGVVIRVMRRDTVKQSNRILMAAWLVVWIGAGVFGFGNVWYQHFHCISELKSGACRVVEGPVTEFRPEHGKTGERLGVGGVTFQYYSANLGGGGMRWTGGEHSPLHVAKYVRIAYDDRGQILKLELRDEPGR